MRTPGGSWNEGKLGNTCADLNWESTGRVSKQIFRNTAQSQSQNHQENPGLRRLSWKQEVHYKKIMLGKFRVTFKLGFGG
jgi:hypothetical protein